MEDFKLYYMDSSEFYELIDSTRVELKKHNEDEKKIFDEKAKKSGLNKSEFFRKIILEYQLSEKQDERFYEFLHQLRGMATNLNQMAKIYNENYGYVNTSKYKTMLDEIESFILGLNEVYVLPKKIWGTNGNNKSMEI